MGCTPQSDHVFKVGATNWLGYQPLFAAQHQGHWDARRINVVELGSATEVIRALATHSLDAAALTLDEAITAKVRDERLEVVLVLDFSRGGDVLISKPGLSSLVDLRGKVVGVENTALGAVMLDAILKRSGLAAGDLQLFPVTYDQHASMLTSGKLDAVITYEPVRSHLLAAGYQDLFNSAEIPDTIVDVLVVGRSLVDRYPDRVAALISGFLSARERVMAKDPATIAGIAKRTKLSSEAVIAGFGLLEMPGLEESRRLLSQCDSGLAKTGEKVMGIMLDSGIVSWPVNLANLCNGRLLDKVKI